MYEKKTNISTQKHSNEYINKQLKAVWWGVKNSQCKRFKLINLRFCDNLTI